MFPAERFFRDPPPESGCHLHLCIRSPRTAHTYVFSHSIVEKIIILGHVCLLPVVCQGTDRAGRNFYADSMQNLLAAIPEVHVFKGNRVILGLRLILFRAGQLFLGEYACNFADNGIELS